MNPLHEAIKDKIVTPALSGRLHPVIGSVVHYDNIQNFAIVETDNPFGVGRVTFDNVPIQIGSGGVHSAGPFVGDEVWMSFLNGNPLFPRITALADEDYMNTTRSDRLKHRRKGSMIPDSLMRW